MRKIVKALYIIVTIIFFDQLTKLIVKSQFLLGESKEIVEGFFSFTYVRNPGAAFGFMAQADESVRKFLFLLIPVIACAWLIILIWKTKESNKLLHLSYSLIFAGAIGNLIDRFAYGYVVDFVDVYYNGTHFPAFNIADSSISIAAGLLVIDFIFHLRIKRVN